jgi:HSP20 family protein
MSYLTRWQRPEVATWPGFGRLTNLQDEIERLFQEPLAEWSKGSQLLSGWTPRLDVYEDKDNVYVKAELPGMKREEIEISLHDGTLSISGERKIESEREGADLYRSERFFGRFQRSVSLPTPVAVDKVNAQYKDGILTIALPKSEEAKPRKIEVSVN